MVYASSTVDCATFYDHGITQLAGVLARVKNPPNLTFFLETSSCSKRVLEVQRRPKFSPAALKQSILVNFGRLFFCRPKGGRNFLVMYDKSMTFRVGVGR